MVDNHILNRVFILLSVTFIIMSKGIKHLIKEYILVYPLCC